MMQQLKEDLKQMKFALLAIFIYVCFMQMIFGTVCPMKAFFGIDCPACGLTHAGICVLLGKWEEACMWNPTIFLWMWCIFWFVLDRYCYRWKVKIFPYGFIIVGILTFVWYCFKLV